MTKLRDFKPEKRRNVKAKILKVIEFREKEREKLLKNLIEPINRDIDRARAVLKYDSYSIECFLKESFRLSEYLKKWFKRGGELK